MKFRFVIPIIFLFPALLAFFGGNVASALDCPNCPAKDLPDLAMLCPECGKDLHRVESKIKARSTASLFIEIAYLGRNQDRLPEYGKVFLNRKYRGNIEIAERKPSQHVQVQLPSETRMEHTALYRFELRNLDEGLVRLDIEMLFPRCFGLRRSLRRLVFPRILLKTGEKTVVRHSFDSVHNFSRAAPASEAVRLGEWQLFTATGVAGIETPVMK